MYPPEFPRTVAVVATASSEINVALELTTPITVTVHANSRTTLHIHVHVRILQHLDDGCDELLNKVVAQEVWPVVVDKVDDEAFDVGAVLVLVCHDHQPAVAQSSKFSGISILLGILQAHDFGKVGDLLVADDLRKRVHGWIIYSTYMHEWQNYAIMHVHMYMYLHSSKSYTCSKSA